MRRLILPLFLATVKCGPVTENYKDQYCTDPRTSTKHAAYTEWADAYSCTRHRCQPGGRSLAIYTVGCKRVEAPESAIECEEVVEDTNMQFPFCCTRLRCLVVVRGEVWTRVLGQPWETLPAAPWSHMYKMKKPPPQDGAFSPKVANQGPVYELTESESDGPRETVLRSAKPTTEAPDCNNSPVPRAAVPPPDIVIALSTNSDPKLPRVDQPIGNIRRKRVQKAVPRMGDSFLEDLDPGSDGKHVENDFEADEPSFTTELNLTKKEKPKEAASDEKYSVKPYLVTKKAQSASWTEIPPNQWNDLEAAGEADMSKDNPYSQQLSEDHKTEVEKPNNLQALVNAIGSRMRDIENVVQKMSAKVKPPPDDAEKKEPADDGAQRKRQKASEEDASPTKVKRPGADQHYKRFSVRNRGSKYLFATDSTTDKPLMVEDNHVSGYFSDASNAVLRRSNGPKEPIQTYMAPVETRRDAGKKSGRDTSEEKKKKKHQHKKKKGKHHKKHHNKKRFNRISSVEVDKNVVSLEDSSAGGV